jgi:hypothetical protein
MNTSFLQTSLAVSVPGINRSANGIDNVALMRSKSAVYQILERVPVCRLKLDTLKSQ